MTEVKEKLPVLILTDISTDCAEQGEPDDTQSLIRLLLYSDVFDIRGLIATYTSHRGRACPEYIRFVLEHYAKVYPDLRRTKRPFTAPEQLFGVVKKGSDTAGEQAVGHGKTTEGSRHLSNVIASADTSVWVLVWGGCTDLRQALFDAKQSMEEAAFSRFCKKINVYSIGDQYDASGTWIRENCPDIFYMTAYDCFRGMYRCGEARDCDASWVADHVTSVGGLGSIYPSYNGGDAYTDIFGRVRGVKEGDTPSFLHLIPNGLCDPMHPEYGSWGGIFEQRSLNRYYDAAMDYKGEKNCWAGIYRYRSAYQNDFAVRLKWSAGAMPDVTYPNVTLNVPTEFCLKYREKKTIAAATDGAHNLRWRYCPEASDFDGVFLLDDHKDGSCTLCAIPRVGAASLKTAHLLLTVTTDTTPYLVCYRRLIVTLEP